MKAVGVTRCVTPCNPMIASYIDDRTRAFHVDGVAHRQWRAFANVALRKLDMVDAAQEVGDLRSPPGNMLEKLSGDREGQWSIRINRQWRVCFTWGDEGPQNVEIVDYHD